MNCDNNNRSFFMAKSGKLERLDFIVFCLKLGDTRGKILSKFGKKWQVSDRTFDRLLKTAIADHTEAQEKIKRKLAEVDEQAAIDARKKAIMTSDERKELLTKIAKGEIKIKRPFVIAGKIMEYMAEPDHTDRRNAVAELNKMGGDYAPAKFATTNAAGEDIPIHPAQIVIQIQPSDELQIKESEE